MSKQINIEFKLLAIGAIFFLALASFAFADEPLPSPSVGAFPTIDPSPTVEIPSPSPTQGPTASIVPSPSAPNPPYDYNPLCGDICEEMDGIIDESDLVCLSDYAFRGAPTPIPLWIGDINGDGIASDVLDVVYLTNYVIRGGPSPNCSGEITIPSPSPSAIASATPAISSATPILPPGSGGGSGNPCDGPCKPSISPSAQASPTGGNTGGLGNATISPTPSKLPSATPNPTQFPSPSIQYYHFVRTNVSPATGFFAIGFAPWQIILALIILAALYLIFRRGGSVEGE
ncbi:MAG: hypothetical protein AABX01_05550 [Candidatus Micrarchaeota archaeon]